MLLSETVSERAISHVVLFLENCGYVTLILFLVYLCSSFAGVEFCAQFCIISVISLISIMAKKLGRKPTGIGAYVEL